MTAPDEGPEATDPRFAGLPQSVVDQAAKAHCSRCGAQVIETPSMAGSVFVQYYVPVLGVRDRRFLCGACGLAFREFIDPHLTEDAVFRAVAAELRRHW